MTSDLLRMAASSTQGMLVAPSTRMPSLLFPTPTKAECQSTQALLLKLWKTLLTDCSRNNGQCNLFIQYKQWWATDATIKLFIWCGMNTVLTRKVMKTEHAWHHHRSFNLETNKWQITKSSTETEKCVENNQKTLQCNSYEAQTHQLFVALYTNSGCALLLSNIWKYGVRYLFSIFSS